MATPTSGAITMDDMRTHINRQTSSSISMDEMRTRYGGSDAISFSDLYGSEGFTVACGRLTIPAAPPFTPELIYDGFAKGFPTIGTVSPDENSSGMVQFAANSYLTSFYALDSAESDTAVLTISSNTAGTGDSGVTTGFKATDITRVVTANTSRSYTGSSNTAGSFTYNFPSTGTIHCLIKLDGT